MSGMETTRQKQERCDQEARLAALAWMDSRISEDEVRWKIASLVLESQILEQEITSQVWGQDQRLVAEVTDQVRDVLIGKITGTDPRYTVSLDVSRIAAGVPVGRWTRQMCRSCLVRVAPRVRRNLREQAYVELDVNTPEVASSPVPIDERGEMLLEQMLKVVFRSRNAERPFWHALTVRRMYELPRMGRGFRLPQAGVWVDLLSNTPSALPEALADNEIRQLFDGYSASQFSWLVERGQEPGAVMLIDALSPRYPNRKKDLLVVADDVSSIAGMTVQNARKIMRAWDAQRTETTASAYATNIRAEIKGPDQLASDQDAWRAVVRRLLPQTDAGELDRAIEDLLLSRVAAA